MLQNYLNNHFKTIFKIFSEVKFALTAIFRIPKVWTWFSSSQLDLLAFSSLLAKLKILFLWKSTKPPGICQWLVGTMYFLKLEKIKCTW